MCTSETPEQVAALRSLTVVQLRARYAAAFGVTTNSRSRSWLRKRVAFRLQQDAERRALSAQAWDRVDELVACVCRRGGGDDRGATVTPPLPRRDPRLPGPGATLIRAHGGVHHTVLVLPSGFEHDGVHYPSLSAVARAITGTHWNGYAFFRLGRTEAAS